MHFFLRKISLLPLFIISILACCSSNAYAQQVNPFGSDDLSNVVVSSYSDAQILEIYKNASAAGYSLAEMLQLAEEKDLPANEISNLRKRLTEIIKSRPNGSDETLSKNKEPDQSRFDSSYQYVPVQKFNNDKTIFGSELFTSSSLVFEPNLRIPPPPNYMLGPGDELVVSVYGYSEKKYDLHVNEIGEIYIPNVGPILVSGFSLEEATQKIKNKLGSTIYHAIRSGKTKVDVTLGKIRSIRVTVIGQAKKPGTYTVSSLTTLFNILYLVGGPTAMGSYRDIEVIRGNEIKRTADLYDFLVYGNQKDNVLLQEGDVIRIPYYKNRVTLSGNLKRQGKFEMLDSERFSDLLKYSGGFTDIAYRGAVTVERISDSERIIIDLPSAQFNSFKIKGSDKYIVGRMQDEYGNRIYADGAVQRPGPYQLSEGLTVKGLIEKAGGLTADAYSRRAIVYRYYKNKMPAVISVSLDSIFNYGQTVHLQKNDSLVVPSIFEFNDKKTVSIEGYVRKPGTIRWRDKLTLRDVLLAVGGITEMGDSSTIEISRRIKNADVEKANHEESDVFIVDLDDGKGGDIPLRPFDLIIVKSKPGYVIQRSVLVQGAVKSPGKYALEKSATTVADVINRTGGFKASADSNSVTIRRISRSTLTVEERKKIFERLLNINPDSLVHNQALQDELYKSYDIISVDLDKALRNPKSASNLNLEDGDILTISRTANLVKVSGEVYFPTIVAYQPNKNLKYYVQQAGNFMPQARKTGALVIHPDGHTKSVKHFLWFKFYPEVTPRSEIYVPRKTPKNGGRITLGEWSVVVSSLAIVANVIFNLSK